MDWIKHTPGDPMPVDGDTVVRVDLADMEYATGLAHLFNWTRPEDGDCVTAYRIVETEPTDPESKAREWVLGATTSELLAMRAALAKIGGK